MSIYVRLEDRPLSAGEEIDRLTSIAGPAGALTAFTGIARPAGADGAPVETLRLDIHPRLTELSLRKIADETFRRFDLTLAAVIHAWGDIPPGGTIVVAAAAAAHRREAFLAADFLMDHLKTEAMFWKQESGPAGAQWVEPTERDLQDLARWKE